MTQEALQIATSRAYVPSHVQVFPSILFEDVFFVPNHREPAVFWLASRVIFQTSCNNGPPVASSELLFKDYPIFVCTPSAILLATLPEIFYHVLFGEPAEVMRE
jgi:hypothetical protein